MRKQLTRSLYRISGSGLLFLTLAGVFIFSRQAQSYPSVPDHQCELFDCMGIGSLPAPNCNQCMFDETFEVYNICFPADLEDCSIATPLRAVKCQGYCFANPSVVCYDQEQNECQ